MCYQAGQATPTCALHHVAHLVSAVRIPTRYPRRPRVEGLDRGATRHLAIPRSRAPPLGREAIMIFRNRWPQNERNISRSARMCACASALCEIIDDLDALVKSSLQLYILMPRALRQRSQLSRAAPVFAV